MNEKDKFWNEREEIYQGLTNNQKRILSAYERKHKCRLQAGAILKVIEDSRENIRCSKNIRKGKKK